MDDPLQQLTGTPSLTEMQLIMTYALPETVQLQNAFEMRRLWEYGIRFYRHRATDTVWLGLDDPQMHDHDRWLLCVVPGELDQWYTVMLDSQLSGRALVFGDLRLKAAHPNREYVHDLVARLYHAHDQYATAARLAQRAVPDRPRAAAYTHLLNGVKHADIALIGTEFNLREMHELLYHYDEWVGRHPEAEGVPREIVMRMHKLAFYSRYEGTSAPVRS